MKRIVSAFLILVFLNGCATTIYQGAECLDGECMKGTGKLRYASGAIYEGSFLKGMPFGQGTMLYADQKKYIGTWQNGEPHDNGQLLGASGALVYKGEFQEGKFHGKGKLNLKDGSLFTGSFRDGFPDEGVLVTESGTRISGKFSGTNYQIGVRGKMVSADGSSHDGGFVSKVADKSDIGILDMEHFVKNGSGRSIMANGDILEGNYSYGILNGEGRLIFNGGRDDKLMQWEQGMVVKEQPGTTTLKRLLKEPLCKLGPAGHNWVFVDGQCRDGRANGEGQAYTLNGKESLFGRFKDGEFVYGTHDKGNGEYFRGEWQNFALNGEGAHISGEKLLYKGKYKDGKRHGEGVCSAGGNYVKCEFYAGDRMDQAYLLSQYAPLPGDLSAKVDREQSQLLAEVENDRREYSERWRRNAEDYSDQRENVSKNLSNALEYSRSQPSTTNEILGIEGVKEMDFNAIIQAENEKNRRLSEQKEKQYQNEVASARERCADKGGRWDSSISRCVVIVEGEKAKSIRLGREKQASKLATWKKICRESGNKWNEQRNSCDNPINNDMKPLGYAYVPTKDPQTGQLTIPTLPTTKQDTTFKKVGDSNADLWGTGSTKSGSSSTSGSNGNGNKNERNSGSLANSGNRNDNTNGTRGSATGAGSEKENSGADKTASVDKSRDNSIPGRTGIDCITDSSSNKKTYFHNRCNETVTIWYCSSDKKMNGKYCGENKSPTNPYYTHSVQIKPGETNEHYDLGDYRYASCMGFILNDSWGGNTGKYFESNNAGGFTCK